MAWSWDSLCGSRTQCPGALYGPCAKSVILPTCRRRLTSMRTWTGKRSVPRTTRLLILYRIYLCRTIAGRCVGITASAGVSESCKTCGDGASRSLKGASMTG